MVYTINDEQLTRRKLITIDGSKATTETGIPLGLNVNLPNVKAAGADVRLAKLDGTPIAREIECVGVPATDDVMIWYPFDTVASTDSQFYVYWGNAALTEPAADSTYGSEAVWNANVEAMYLMSNSTSLVDSTNNSNDGTKYGDPTISDDDYGKKTAFDGNDYYDTSTGITPTDTTTITLKLGSKGTQTAYHYLFDRGPNADGWGDFGLLYDVSGNLVFTVNDGGAGEQEIVCTYASLSNGDILTFLVNYPSLKVYKNGISTPLADLTFTKHFNYGTSPLSIARAGAYNNYYYNGELEYLQFDNSVRTVNYITTTHKNLNNPTATGTSPFYLSIGEPQHQRRVPTYL